MKAWRCAAMARPAPVFIRPASVSSFSWKWFSVVACATIVKKYKQM